MFFFLKWLQCNVASEMQHPCLSENVNTNSSVGQLLINQLLDKSVNQTTLQAQTSIVNHGSLSGALS